MSDFPRNRINLTTIFKHSWVKTPPRIIARAPRLARVLKYNNKESMKTNNLDPKLSQALLGSDNYGHFTKSKGNLYEFYLSGEIVEAEEYIEWFDTKF